MFGCLPMRNRNQRRDCRTLVFALVLVGLNDVGRISLDRGSARGPGGPTPRSSIQERNERETKKESQSQIEPRGSLHFVGPHVRPRRPCYFPTLRLDEIKNQSAHTHTHTKLDAQFGFTFFSLVFDAVRVLDL